MLKSWATVQMWRFSLDSTTSVVGVVIMITGIIITLLRTVLSLLVPDSPCDLVVTGPLHGLEQARINGMPLRFE
ncbi:hypothetical protein ASPZODRAFT_677924 [Penicilliopsis zonata CBS 506.65]|uniref:Uncharacterized protein n=1 Tax=Penicilliopsis zonata CBS 506.65 TaxID=1073090 RepID=A0A1L9SDA7_9EURO|nr:hypothetical protein ASPZODRAFT_677924 [Penicilliopsis zonata CBS 506.65]OJJ45118.1 hypothetical protein ASPZODRAFT_677924 [Penicilliopsis zonata CBS 506.65]